MTSVVLSRWCVALFLLQVANSRTTIWKLSEDATKIVESGASYDGTLDTFKDDDDQIFKIISSTVLFGEGWMKQGGEGANCKSCIISGRARDSHLYDSAEFDDIEDEVVETVQRDDHVDLSCGKPANFTFYDHLVGVLNRNRHPNVPEPQLSLIFSKKQQFSVEDLQSFEQKLKKAQDEQPHTPQLFNRIGNYFRIRGDSRAAIECFRLALALAPYNADTLLNLARVLFTVQYMDDAIYLTRRSLEVQPPDRQPWKQYFTLGEIFKSYGHYQKASIHFKHALELKPGFEPASAALRDIVLPAPTIHVYTAIIIICLVLCVLVAILSSVDVIDYIKIYKILSDFRFA